MSFDNGVPGSQPQSLTKGEHQVKTVSTWFSLFAFALLSTGCSGMSMSSLASLADNPMVQSMMKQVGTSLPQTVGGSGALFNLAQTKLPAQDAAKLYHSVPNMNQILDQSKVLGGFKNVGSMEEANAVMSKLGMSAEQTAKMPNALADFMGSNASPGVADLLKSVWK